MDLNWYTPLEHKRVSRKELKLFNEIGKKAVLAGILLTGFWVNGVFGLVRYPNLDSVKIGGIPRMTGDYHASLKQMRRYCYPNVIQLVGNGFDLAVCDHYLGEMERANTPDALKKLEEVNLNNEQQQNAMEKSMADQVAAYVSQNAASVAPVPTNGGY